MKKWLSENKPCPLIIKRGDRYEIIGKIVSHKNVLDIGCVDHDYEKAIKNNKDAWLHGFICKKAQKCTGIDLEKNEINKLNKLGYHCIHANAENFRLNEKFDVIVAGEVIEHLYNPGKFLECVKKHLKKGGKFILTTPNPYHYRQIIQILLAGRPYLRSDHTCIFEPQTLSYLMKQHEFEIEDIYWINFTPNKYTLGYIISKIGYFNSNFLVIANLSDKNEK